MLLTPYPAGFIPAANDIRFDMSAFATRARRLVVTRASPLLTPDQRQILCDLAEWNLLFPCIQPNTGRSLYAQVTQPSTWPFSGLKMKGGGGLKWNDGTDSWLCYPPQPGENFGVGRELHLALNAGLELYTVTSKPRALNSLRDTAADSEFDCQTALANAGLGFTGLLAGHFMKANESSPELDLHGNPTGVAISAFDPDFQVLSDHLHYLLFEDAGGIVVRVPPRGVLNTIHGPCTEFINHYLKFLERIGQVKGQCALRAGVARHACHLGNFLYNANQNLLWVTDTDSCVLYASLPEALRGPQLLRDLSSDLWRCIKDITFSSFCTPFLLGLHTGAYLPFHQFLSGYFSGQAFVGDVITHATALHQRYLAYLRRFGMELKRIHNAHADRYLRDDQRFSGVMIQATWYTAMLPFILEIFTICFNLLKRSALPQAGFTLPDISVEQFRHQIKSGLIANLAEVEAESRDAKAKMGITQTEETPIMKALRAYLA